MYVIVYLVKAMGVVVELVMVMVMVLVLGSQVMVHHYKVRRFFCKRRLVLTSYNWLKKLTCNGESNPCSADPLDPSHLRI